MRIRHVIDESGMRLIDGSLDTLGETIDAFLDRIDTARDRHEVVARSTELYDTVVMDGLVFHDLLYGNNSPLSVDINRLRRLRVAIDRLEFWTETDALHLMSDFDVSIDGHSFFAPSLAYAHACRSLPHTVGCIVFNGAGRQGPVEVLVGEQAHVLHFIVDDSTHIQLFRDAVDLESMDESRFEDNATSAFPKLLWAEGVWRGLSSFQRPYLEHRATLVKHLAALNDVAAEIFAGLSASHPEQISGHFGAYGVDASDENGRTKRDNESIRDRTRRFQGRDHVFWWHTKLLRNTDRIHFMWRKNDTDPPGPGEIIIGIFTDHCHLPG